MLTVQTPAPDRNLLTLAEIKAALDISDTSQDALLTELGLQISDVIARACGVVADGVTPPALRRETLVETIRLTSTQTSIMLSRRFVVAVTSVVCAGVTLAPENYELDASAGVMRNVGVGGAYRLWPAGLTAVTYDAGFDTVPGPLKLAARTLLQEAWASVSRDPLLKAQKFEGLGTFEWYQGATGGAGIAASVTDILAPYRTQAV